LGKDRVVKRLRAAGSIPSPNRDSESLGVVRE